MINQQQRIHASTLAMNALNIERKNMKTVIIAVIGATLCACQPHYSDGSWVGVVTKLSRKGVIFKSWEGELLVGGTRPKTTTHYDSEGKYAGSTTSMVPNVMAFNVDESMVQKVKAAQESGEPVELVYRQWFISPLTIDHDHVIIDVKPIK